MTDPLVPRLRALIEQWRDYVEGAIYMSGIETCANDLEALLSAHEAAQPAVEKSQNEQAWEDLRADGGLPEVPRVEMTPHPFNSRTHEIHRASAEAAPVERPEGWQPIETAPKDGTWILLGAAGWTLPGIGQWSRLSNCWQDFDTAVYEPTHWMPLPALPPSTERQP